MKIKLGKTQTEEEKRFQPKQKGPMGSCYPSRDNALIQGSTTLQSTFLGKNHKNTAEGKDVREGG